MTKKDRDSEFAVLDAILREDYRDMGLVDLKGDWYKDDRRWSATDPQGRRVVINAHIVGPRRSAMYKGWLFVSRLNWEAITAPQPDIFVSYTWMIGVAPDNNGVWWHIMYRNRELAKIIPYMVMNDRMRRIPYSMAMVASVSGLIDRFQPTIWTTTTTSTEGETDVRTISIDR